MGKLTLCSRTISVALKLTFQPCSDFVGLTEVTTDHNQQPIPTEWTGRTVGWIYQHKVNVFPLLNFIWMISKAQMQTARTKQ